MTNTPQPLKFWHQSMTELSGQGAYSRYLSSHAKKMLGDEVHVDVRGLRDGTYHGHAPTDALENAFVYHRVCDQIIDNAMQAEREGYDAFVIGSFSEPYLREIRSAVNITVTSVLETSMLVACSLGKKTAAIANAPQIAFMVQSAVEKHGLSSRVLPVISVEPPLTEPQMAKAFENPAPLLAAFVKAAEEAVRGGADFIVPAESILATLVVDSGITQIAGAPVMDVIAVAWHYTLMLVRLKSDSALQVSHIGHYARAEPALMAAFTTPH